MAQIDFHNTPVVNVAGFPFPVASVFGRTGAVVAAASDYAESQISFTDITTNDVSTTMHGYTPKLPNDATKFLNGVGGFTVPAGSGFGAVLFDSTLGGAAATIDTGAGGIAGGFATLRILAYLRTTEAVALSSFVARVNNDSSAIYDRIRTRTINATVSGANSLAQTGWAINSAGASLTAGVFGVHTFEIPNYDGGVGNTYGTEQGGVAAQAAADTLMEVFTLGYRSTTAVTRFSLLAGGASNFVAGSRLTVLGIG